MKPLAAYASQVKNDVLGGLTATDDFPISLEQIKDTLVSMRARILDELMAGKTKVNLLGFYQIIPKLPLTEDKDRRVFTGAIPPLISITNLNAVRYFGQPNFRKPYRVKFTHRYTQGADIRTGHEPLVHIDANFNFEMSKKDCGDKRELAIEAIFSNPRDVRRFGCVYDDEETVFPMPEKLADVIVGKLTNDYLRNYGRANPQPNTGTMIMNPVPNQPQQ